MGKVVRFPGVWQAGRRAKSVGKKAESAIVIILPVIRIERFSDTPPEGERMRQVRRRRRRASRP
jgi:hypothetical protein